MSYYRIITSLFIASLGQGVFASAATSAAPDNKDPLGFLDDPDFLEGIVPGELCLDIA